MELPGSCYQDCECPKWLDFQVSPLFDLLRGWTCTIWKVLSVDSLRIIVRLVIGLLVRLFKNDLSVWIRRTDLPQPVFVPVRAEEVSWLLWWRWVLKKCKNKRKLQKNTVIMFGKFNRYQIRSHVDAWRVQEETLYPQIKKSTSDQKQPDVEKQNHCKRYCAAQIYTFSILIPLFFSELSLIIWWTNPMLANQDLVNFGPTWWSLK